MFSCRVEGTVVAVKDDKAKDGKPIKVIQLMQMTRNGFGNLIFVRSENGLVAEVGKKLAVDVDCLPYVRKNGTAEIMLRTDK